MRIWWLVLLAAALSSTAFAADIDGTWSGTVDGPSGPVEVKYHFMAEGAKLTGSTVTPDGAEVMIKDGKIDGASISFAVDLDLGGTAMRFTYTGVLSGSEVKLHTEYTGQPFDFTVKKSG
jgi:opacity protein-like surface antigen